MSEPQQFFTAPEAASLLRYSPATLAIWRSRAEGPVYMKIGSSVRYRRRDLEAWVTMSESERRETVESAECHRAQRNRVKRARGRAGADQRKRRLSIEPNCRDCAVRGDVRRAEEVDHIVPIAVGGKDTDDNVRCLCRFCHATRTAESRSSLKNDIK